MTHASVAWSPFDFCVTHSVSVSTSTVNCKLNAPVVLFLGVNQLAFICPFASSTSDQGVIGSFVAIFSFSFFVGLSLMHLSLCWQRLQQVSKFSPPHCLKWMNYIWFLYCGKCLKILRYNLLAPERFEWNFICNFQANLNDWWLRHKSVMSVVKLPWCECQWTSLMINQHWFR